MINHSHICTRCKKDILEDNQFHIKEYDWFFCEKCANEYYKLVDELSEKFLLDI